MGRKKPHKPGQPIPHQSRVHLGLPTPEREAKSHGYDVDTLAGDTKRAREKMILTPPDVRREMIAEAIKDLRSRGIFELDGTEIRIKETAADRLLNPAEHEAICWYIRVHAKVVSGHVKIGNYGQRVGQSDCKGEDERDRPIVDEDKAMHAELQRVLPEPHLAFLEWLAWHEFPAMKDGSAPDKIDIGKAIIDSRDARRGEGGLEGFLRAVAQNISHWRGDIETLWQRRELVKKEYIANQKKNRYG